ncbi:hypothetical protein N2152v2_005303 [Parachlorella kessleri]
MRFGFNCLGQLAATAKYALTWEELQALPSTGSVLHEHGVAPSCYVAVEEPCYREYDVLLAAYRKWRTPQALQRGRRRLAWEAADAKQERHALLQRRLRQEGLSCLSMNSKMVRDYVETGLAPLDSMVEKLRREAQRRESIRLLRARLAKEGLFDVNIQTGPCRKFLQGAMDLDHVVEVLLAERFMQEREEELHTRLEKESLLQYLDTNVCERHLADPTSSLSSVIRRIKALHTRLAAEGLDVSRYWNTALCQVHLVHHRHPRLKLDRVIEGIRASQRRWELWQRWP